MDFDAKNCRRLVARLRPRERQVLIAVASGKPRKQIATDLDLSIRTVSAYLTSTYRKLNVFSNVMATRVAAAARIV